MLILHPTIYLDVSGTTTDALLVRDGQVVAVGDEAHHGAGGDATLRPDGACLFPALGDAHVHLWGLGMRAGTVDLRGLDADRALEALADAEPQADGWIFGTNLDEHHFRDGQSLTRDDLDRLFPTNPVRIHRVDRHAIWVNSAALQRASITEHFESGADGHLARDDQGRLTGYLVDAAMEPVHAVIPRTTVAEDRAVFLECAEKMRAFGMAFGTIARTSVAHVAMLKALADHGDLPIHVDALVAGTDPQFDDWRAEGPLLQIDQGLRVAGVKFYADGALGSAGAHLLEPYRTGGTGLAMHEPGFLQERIPQLMADGWQVAVHAIGDAAAREVLDAFEAVPQTIRQRLRPRLEHAQMLTDDDCRRLRDLAVIASIQPIHLRSDAPWAPDLLHEPQLDRLFPWRALNPDRLAGGSDFPIDDLNPWHGIATALTRRGADGISFRPDHALTRQEALRAYTSGAAFASHREAFLGHLTPGSRAEILSLNSDPFNATADEIWSMEASWVR